MVPIPMQEIIKNALMDFETAVGTDAKNAKIRIDTVDVIRITLKSNPHQRKLYKFRKQLTKLREEKDIGNNTAILNKDDYSQSTEEFIESGPCEMVNFDPLPSMLRMFRSTTQYIHSEESANLFDEEENSTLKTRILSKNTAIK